MVLSIYAIFTSSVLCANALAILSETRLLSKLGLATTHTQLGAAEQQESPRSGGFVPQPFDNNGIMHSSIFGSPTLTLNTTGSALSSPPGSSSINYKVASHTSRTRAQIAILLSSIRTLLR